MRGRRRDARYRLSVPFEGALAVLQDLKVERYDTRGVVAVSDAPGDLGQHLTLDLMGSGSRVTVQVRVVESSPVIVDGHVHYRLRLAIVD